MRQVWIIYTLVGALLITPSCSTATPNGLDFLGSMKNLSVLSGIADVVGSSVTDVLSGNDDFTLLALDNVAYATALGGLMGQDFSTSSVTDIISAVTSLKNAAEGTAQAAQYARLASFVAGSVLSGKHDLLSGALPASFTSPVPNSTPLSFSKNSSGNFVLPNLAEGGSTVVYRAQEEAISNGNVYVLSPISGQ